MLFKSQQSFRLNDFSYNGFQFSFKSSLAEFKLKTFLLILNYLILIDYLTDS